MVARKREPMVLEEAQRPVSGFRRVARPLSTRGRWLLDAELQALMETAEKKDAVEYDIKNPAELHKIHMAMRHFAAQKHYRFRYRHVAKDKLQAWVETIK